jgi:hypothetical protein
MTLEGVDLASHQGDYAYPTNPDFAVPKASGGHAYRNPYLPQQVANARARNIVVHFYHYMFEPLSGGGDVALEAQNFIEACRPYVQQGSMFWLDVEEFPAKVGYTGDLGDWIVAFCEAVERAFGVVCGVYCATWYLTATGLNRDVRLRKYPFWMASWQEDVPAPVFMAPWSSLTLHQYDANGIDKDRFYGTREELLALGVPAPSGPPSPDPVVARTYLDPNGVPVTEIRWGGQAVEVLGTEYANIGTRVRNIAGDIYHRSILDGQGQPYVKE